MNMQATMTKERSGRAQTLDVGAVRQDFPILEERIHGKPLVYLDNAATAQKPRSVIDCVKHYYSHDNSNIHRGVHLLSERATEAYENTRIKVKDFLNAADAREIVFVRGTTEAINLVAHSYGGSHVKEGDEVVISAMEHHSNIVPWQLLCAAKGASLRVVPITDEGEIPLSDYTKALGSRTKLVALAHVSNALGTVNPVKQMIEEAHARGIPVLVDGAQAAPHLPVDVRELGCDFYAFSGHKLYGPTGVGVLYGKSELLEQMPPYQGGGDMIRVVTFEKTEYNDLPYKFEAGTPNMAGVIGLGAAIDYAQSLGLGPLAEHEDRLLRHAVEKLGSMQEVRLIGNPTTRVSLVSFVLEGIHAHDVGTILDQEGVAVRTGHHCAMPVMDRFGVPATVRASFACYNTEGEVDALVNGLEKALEVFGSG